MKRFFLIVAAYFLLSNLLFSQRMKVWENPDYGADSLARMECAQNLSTMSEFMRINLPDYALSSWRKVFEICPSSSKNIYILGTRIFSHQIENAEDPALRQGYMDTLMLLYDKRIEYFGEEGTVLGRKATDVIKYGDTEAFEEAYPLFKKSAKIMCDETETNVLIGLSETGFAMLRAGKISMVDFLENYLFLNDIIEQQLSNARTRSRANIAKERVDANLADAEINNCDAIEEAFKSRLESSPDDKDIIITAATLLKNADCIQDDFFGTVFLSVFKFNPTADNAAELSRFYIRNNDYSNALEYVINSFELEENDEKKAQYALQASVIYYSRLQEYKKAAEYALIASELRPNWAEPYFALAPAYVEGIKGCHTDEFERRTIFWLVADIMEKAAQVDPANAGRARNQLNEYKRYFPPKEEAFFRGIQSGSSYSIGCWINQKTTVRFN